MIPVPDSIKNILRRRSVKQVVKLVVAGITVPMTDLLSGLARVIQESFCNKYVNIEALMLLSLREADATVSILINSSGEKLAGLEVTDTAFAAYLIPFPEWDW